MFYGTKREGGLDKVADGTARSYTSLIYVDPEVYDPTMGVASATVEEVRDLSGGSTKGIMTYKKSSSVYSSPVVHTVALNDLKPGTRYYYSVQDKVRSFVFPKSDYPMTFGLTADVGQTVVSERSLDGLLEMNPDLVLLAGDLSYADGWPFRWDTFGKLAESLASRVPVLVTGGNHEIGDSENWVHFTERWPTPFVSSHSTSPLYWSVDVGRVHIIALNSYDNFEQGGDRLQREWLAKDLSGLDRSKTPWLVVMMHVPFYSSNLAHPGEAETMRLAYEPMLYNAGVDLVLTGHVHAYERSAPVYDGQIDDCGPIHLTLGDGGNREDVSTTWARPQPPWSLFRESSFGVGKIEFLDDNTARYEWRRHSCENADFHPDCRSRGDNSDNHKAVDSIIITRRLRENCVAALPYSSSEQAPLAKASRVLFSWTTTCILAVIALVTLGILVVSITVSENGDIRKPVFVSYASALFSKSPPRNGASRISAYSSLPTTTTPTTASSTRETSFAAAESTYQSTSSTNSPGFPVSIVGTRDSSLA